MNGLLNFLKIVYFRHRNSQKRIIFEDACYFITSKTYNNYPYFRERIFCDLFVENLRLCKRLKGFLLYGWVLNYDHFHLLIQPNDEWNISKSMFSIKKQFAHNCNIVMGFNKSYEYSQSVRQTNADHPEGGQSIARLQDKWINCNSGYQSLMQEMRKFDIFLQISKIRFKFKYGNKNPFPKFQWQESFNDHYIRNDWDFNDKLEYIAWNPEKHGLPDDWPYIYTNPKYDDLTDI